MIENKHSLMDETIHILFDFLDIIDIPPLGLVCKKWYITSREKMSAAGFWQKKYQSEFGQNLSNIWIRDLCFCTLNNTKCKNKYSPKTSFTYPRECEMHPESFTDQNWKEIYQEMKLELHYGIPFHVPNVLDWKPTWHVNGRCVKPLFLNRKKILKMYQQVFSRKLKEWEFFHHRQFDELYGWEKRQVVKTLCEKYIFYKFGLINKYNKISFQSTSDLIGGGVTVTAVYSRKDKGTMDNLELNENAKLIDVIQELEYLYTIYVNGKGELISLDEKITKREKHVY